MAGGDARDERATRRARDRPAHGDGAVRTPRPRRQPRAAGAAPGPRRRAAALRLPAGLHTLIGREGVVANHKRVDAVDGQAGRQVRRQPLPRGERVPWPAPSRPGERWSRDFMVDTLADGRPCRTLSIVDDFTRECLAIEGDRSLPGARVVCVLARLRAARGLPQTIVTDNGPACAGRTRAAWAYAAGVTLRFRRPARRSSTPTSRASTARFATHAAPNTGASAWSTRRSRSTRGASTTTRSGRTGRCSIARPTSLLSFRGGLGGCRRLALGIRNPRRDSHYPCSGFVGQVTAVNVSVVNHGGRFSGVDQWPDLSTAGNQSGPRLASAPGSILANTEAGQFFMTTE